MFVCFTVYSNTSCVIIMTSDVLFLCFTVYPDTSGVIIMTSDVVFICVSLMWLLDDDGTRNGNLSHCSHRYAELMLAYCWVSVVDEEPALNQHCFKVLCFLCWLYSDVAGGGPRVVVSTAAFHARVRGSVPGLGGFKETKNVSSPSTCES